MPLYVCVRLITGASNIVAAWPTFLVYSRLLVNKLFGKFLRMTVCIHIIPLCFIFHPQTESQIFPPTTGGAEKMASDMGVPFLGRLPLDPRIAKCCDEGKSFLSEVPDSPAAKAYAAIIKGIA